MSCFFMFVVFALQSSHLEFEHLRCILFLYLVLPLIGACYILWLLLPSLSHSQLAVGP